MEETPWWRSRLPALPISLTDTSCSVRDPELEEPGEARYREQGSGSKKPPPEAPAGQPGHDRSQHRSAGTHRGDHVAHPVDEVQERPFWLGARFALNRHVALRRRPEALC